MNVHRFWSVKSGRIQFFVAVKIINRPKNTSEEPSFQTLPQTHQIKTLRHLGPIYTKRQRQLCDDACDSILIEISGVA